MEYDAVDLDLERHRYEKRRRRERAEHHAIRILEVAREGDVLPVRRALMQLAEEVVPFGEDDGLPKKERRRRRGMIVRMRRTAVAIALKLRTDAARNIRRFTHEEVDQVATKQQELRERIREYAVEIDRTKPDITATDAVNLVRLRYGAEAQKLGVSLEYMNFLTTYWHKLRPPKARKAKVAKRAAEQPAPAPKAQPKPERGGTPAAAARTKAAAADKPARAVANVKERGHGRVYRGSIAVEVQVLAAGSVRLIYDIPEQLAAHLLPGLKLNGATG